jgi:hypothetical protein
MGHPKAHFYTRGWVGGGFCPPFKKKEGSGQKKVVFLKKKY